MSISPISMAIFHSFLYVYQRLVPKSFIEMGFAMIKPASFFGYIHVCPSFEGYIKPTSTGHVPPRKSHEDWNRLHGFSQRPAGGRRHRRLPRGRHHGSAEAPDLSARRRAAAELEERGALRQGRDLDGWGLAFFWGTPKWDWKTMKYRDSMGFSWDGD